MTQRREGAKGAKKRGMAARVLIDIPAFYPAILTPAILALYPVIPAKAGIHRVAKPSQPSEIKYELKSADPLSLYGRGLG